MIKIHFHSDGSVNVETSMNSSSVQVHRVSDAEIVVTILEQNVSAFPKTKVLFYGGLPTETDQYTQHVGSPKKIPAIKVIREATGLGLGEAKELVERATPMSPVIITCKNSEDALRLRNELLSFGAIAELT